MNKNLVQVRLWCPDCHLIINFDGVDMENERLIFEMCNAIRDGKMNSNLKMDVVGISSSDNKGDAKVSVRVVS